MRKFLMLPLMLISLFGTAQTFYMFVGTYTNKGSKGIYVYRFNAETGIAELVSNTDGVVNPSYLAIAPNKKYVYAVNETNGKNPGKVSAFSFDKNTGQLTFINQQLSNGDDPCYVSVSKNNDWIMVANYSGGSLSALSVNKDGSLNAAGQIIQHEGRSIDKRQAKAHVHETVFSPDYKYLLTPDLGLDKVVVYKFNPAAQTPLSPATPPFVQVDAGNGPRHITFHPNKKSAYLIEELTGTIGAYAYNGGKLTLIQHIAAHPADFKGEIGSAEIDVSADGKFLYASNRGDENNIAIFAIDKAGKLQLVGYQPTVGKAPRHFIIDPTGNFLLVANQDSDNIVIFKRDKQTGKLTETGNQIKVSMPVCVQILK